jgi:hypothetical protein
MTTLEQQIIQQVHLLNPDDQRKVLEFMEGLHQKSPGRYSPRELMRLPEAERNRLVAEAFDRAATMDFETFEAYSEELDDES